jgi:hypothetical protein
MIEIDDDTVTQAYEVASNLTENTTTAIEAHLILEVADSLLTMREQQDRLQNVVAAYYEDGDEIVNVDSPYELVKFAFDLEYVETAVVTVEQFASDAVKEADRR